MKNGKYGFGLVGCGLISVFHAKAVKHSKRMELISVTDLDANRAKKIADEFGCKVVTFEEMLSDPNIDIVNVLTPNAFHSDFVIKAAEAKKHVIVEKPPEMDLGKVDKMIQAGSINNVKIAVSLQCRFRKVVEAIKKAYDDGRFGKILYSSAYMKWFRATEYYKMDAWRSLKAQGAGVTIQQAFHYLDLIIHITGDVNKVYAKMINIAHPGVELEDTVQAFIEFKNGAVGSLEATTACYPGIDIRIEICGENGFAVMKGDRIDEWKFRDELPEDSEIRKIGDPNAQTASSGAAALSFIEHNYLFEDFIDAIINDRDPRVTLEEGKRTLEVALKLYESADKKQWVNI
jgi:UDP-N-acetyl-2-amino-2-deoxyglucuronate dehydrogenase